MALPLVPATAPLFPAMDVLGIGKQGLEPISKLTKGARNELLPFNEEPSEEHSQRAT
jgi:hypothetical protein